MSRRGEGEAVVAYLDSTCVLGIELNNGLSTAGYFDLVLRAEARHDYIVPQSVPLYTWHTCLASRSGGAPLIVLEPLWLVC